MKLFEILADDWIATMRGHGHDIGQSLIIKDNMVYSKSNVYLNHLGLTSIPVKFADTNFSFYVHTNKLTSLEGCPSKCADFDADYNQLTNLANGPTEASGKYSVFRNKITSLKGCPKFVGDDFDVADNSLTEIDDAPETILGNFDLTNNNIKSLHNIHKHCKRCNGTIYLSGNPIKQNILGLLMINGLESIHLDKDSTNELKRSVEIISKYLGKGKQGVLDAQEELIDSGLDDFAEL